MKKDYIILVSEELKISGTNYYEFHEALTLLEEENKRLVREKKSGSCTVELYSRQNELIFAQELYFPLNKPIEEEMKGLLFKKQKIALESEIQREKSVKQTEDFSNVIIVEESPKKEFKLPKNVLPNMKIASPYFKKGWLFFCSVVKKVLLFIMSSSIYRTVKWNFKQKSIRYLDQHFKRYMEQHKYFKAARLFPKRIGLIERHIVMRREYQLLEKFQQQFPTSEGAFDLAFYKEDWNSLVNIHLERMNYAQQCMLAIGYVKRGDIERAEMMQSHLENEMVLEEIIKGKVSQMFIMVRTLNWLEVDILYEEIKESPYAPENLDRIWKEISLYREMFEKNKDPDEKERWIKLISQYEGVVTE